MTWKAGGTEFAITVENPEHRCHGVARVTLDGASVPPRSIPLLHDGARHDVRVVMGEPVHESTPPGAASWELPAAGSSGA